MPISPDSFWLPKYGDQLDYINKLNTAAILHANGGNELTDSLLAEWQQHRKILEVRQSWSTEFIRQIPEMSARVQAVNAIDNLIIVCRRVMAGDKSPSFDTCIKQARRAYVELEQVRENPIKY